MSVFTKPEMTAERGDFYQRAAEKGLVPLWQNLERLVPVVPNPSCVPVVWQYDLVRQFVMDAGTLITAEEAERRVMILENPGIVGSRQVTNSLYAGVQLILPGEVAPTHRHAAGALRLVIESDGAYTAVDGERTVMHPGDFIITPSWTFHDHGNNTGTPTIWMDGLDMPIVNYFDTSFVERYPGAYQQPVCRAEDDNQVRYGTNLLPLDYKPQSLTSPIFNYPYSRTREALERLHRNGPLDPCHGIKMQYVNPATGGYPMPTIATFIQLLPAGFKTEPYRSTDSTTFAVVEGSGKSRVGDTSLEWNKHDIFVVPSWNCAIHEATQESILFSFSDRAVQKVMGLWREQRGA